MKKSSISSLLMYILQALAIEQLLACSCLHEHPQAKYCSADFVIKFKVVSQDFVLDNPDGSYEPVNLVSPPDGFLFTDTSGFKKPPLETHPVNSDIDLWYRALARYTIADVEVFKGDELLEGRNLTTIYSALDEGRCGVLLHSGVIYYYMGHFTDDNIHVSRCEFLIPSNMYTDEELNTIRSNIIHEWPEGCDSCNIIPTCQDSYLPDICTMESMFVSLGVESIIKDTCVMENLILDMDKTFAETACIQVDEKCIWVVVGENHNVYLPDFPIDLNLLSVPDEEPPIPDMYDIPDLLDHTDVEEEDEPSIRPNTIHVDHPMEPKTRSLEVNTSGHP